MESSGGGVTFTEHDLGMMKMLIGLLNKASFNGLSAVQTIQAASALEFAQSLGQLIEQNILEIKVIKGKNSAVQENYSPTEPGS